jgi:hypothetical protein
MGAEKGDALNSRKFGVHVQSRNSTICRASGAQYVVADGTNGRARKPAMFYVLLVPVCLEGVALRTNGLFYYRLICWQLAIHITANGEHLAGE